MTKSLRGKAGLGAARFGLVWYGLAKLGESRSGSLRHGLFPKEASIMGASLGHQYP